MSWSKIAVFFAIAVSSCNDNDQQENRALSSGHIDTLVSRDTVVTDRPITGPGVDIPLNVQLDSVIHLAFGKDSNTVVVKAHMGKKGDPVICYLPVTRGSKLTAIILPDKKKANIRFNQIFLPDGQSDGPFGQTLQYKLAKKGVYKIYIGPSMMADDPFAGDFLLRVKVE